MEKILGDNEYLKSLISQCEKTVTKEVEKRLRTEFENKYWVDQKLTVFKEEMVLLKISQNL